MTIPEMIACEKCGAPRRRFIPIGATPENSAEYRICMACIAQPQIERAKVEKQKETEYRESQSEIRQMREEIIKAANAQRREPKDGEPDCPKCNNNRSQSFIKDYEDGSWYEHSRVCECVDVIRSMHRINRSGLGEHVSALTFENFKATEPFQKAMFAKALAFLEHDGRWLAMLGQTGAGKTHLCTAVCNELMKRGNSLIYLRWAKEIKNLKAIANSDEYAHELRAIFRHDCIYIDDLFKRGKNAAPTDADVKIAFELINTAQEMGKVVIISGEDLFEHLIAIDEAIAGRIKQCAKEFVVSINKDVKRNYRFKGVGSI